MLWDLLSVVWMNVLLSGDNAIMVGMAVRALPPGSARRRVAFVGTSVAIAARIILTLGAEKLFDYPYVSLVGGALLVLVAIRMAARNEGSSKPASRTSEWGILGAIIVGDLVMSLDNVLAVAAVSNGDTLALTVGLIVMIPIMLVGARSVLWITEKFPVIVVVGALYLGYVAGQLASGDPLLSQSDGWVQLSLSITGTVIVGVCYAYGRLMRRKEVLREQNDR